MKRHFIYVYWRIFFLTIVFLFLSCGTSRVVPITGRKQHIGYSDREMLNMIIPYYNKEVQSTGISTNKAQKTMVERVTKRLTQAANNYLKNNGYSSELQWYQWEAHLLKNQEPNACCYPGGKIVVYEGILPIVGNEAGLAAVLGHEIGHAIGKHSAESNTKRRTWSVWQIVGATAFQMAGSGTDVAQQTVDLSNEVLKYVDLKYSRKHEHEADHIGLILMAMAGYDPHEGPKVWERMTAALGDNKVRILSTHPSNEKRMRWMRDKWMSEALKYYRPATTKGNITPTKKKSGI